MIAIQSFISIILFSCEKPAKNSPEHDRKYTNECGNYYLGHLLSYIP